MKTKKTKTLRVGTACLHGSPACEECRAPRALEAFVKGGMNAQRAVDALTKKRTIGGR